MSVRISRVNCVLVLSSSSCPVKESSALRGRMRRTPWHCLLFEAVRNGRALIGAVLDSPATGPAAGAQDAARMLNWGFGLRRTN